MKRVTAEHEFQTTFDTYGDAIFRFCMLKVSHQPLAEDMTQEVFMRYWQYLRAGKTMTNTKSLLYTIAHNLAKDWYKKKKTESLDAHMAVGHEPPAGGNSPEVDAMYQELLSVIHDLDDDDRELILLRHIEGMGPKDIAIIMGESANTISVRINRATKRLHIQLGI